MMQILEYFIQTITWIFTVLLPKLAIGIWQNNVVRSFIIIVGIAALITIAITNIINSLK